ncbi:MAG: pleC 1 [Rhodospirillales bacterium]|jgi:PAS domain S-box-containing protein|nr:pleC 1 [Rhodospirillales bacterium]
MDDFNLTPDILRTKTKEELIEIVRAQRSTHERATVSKSDGIYNFEDVIEGLFDHSMIPMIMVDELGRFQRINRAFKDVTGYEDSDILGRTIGDNTHPTDHDEVDVVRKGLLSGGAITEVAEKKIVRKDGSVMSCRVKRLLIRDQSGATKFLISEIVDLTDQQNQMLELYRQRTLFETLFWEMPDALVFLDPDRTVKMYNTAYAELFGYDSHELIGHSTRKLFANDEEYELRGRYTAEAERRIEPHMQQFRRKDGTIFTGENIGAVVRDHDGAPLGLIGLVRDVTDRDKIHRALVESERRFQDFAQAGAYRFWETDVEGRYTYLSPSNRAFPNSEELLIGRYQFKSPNFRYEDADLQDVLAHIARREPYQDFHHMVTDARGRRYRSTSGVPVFDATGAFAGYRGVSLDETGEVLARREAETLSARFHAAIGNFHAGFALWSADRRFVTCNEFYRRASGASAETLKPGASFEDFIRARAQQIEPHRGIDIEAWIAARNADFDVPMTSHEYCDPDGTWYRITKQRLPNGDTLFFMAEITLTKIREDELITAKLVAESASRAKSEFLSNVSHELRTPLNAILGFAQIIERASPSMTTEKFARFGGIIRENGTYLLDLINGILDLSAIEAGRLNLVEDTVDLAALGEDTIQLVRLRAGEDNINLVNSIGYNAPRIQVDQVKMKQVLVNLLTNAIKFTPAGGQVELSFAHTGDGLNICVSDDGIGMSDEEITLALEKFGRIGRSRKAARDGLGLGLPLAKELIEAHGGALSLASVPNGGTTVTISLPGSRILS